MTPRVRFLGVSERAMMVLLGALLLGSALAFGGAVWWARPVGLLLTMLLVLTALARSLVRGRSTSIHRSPLALLGALVLLLAVVQLLPLPPRFAGRLSANSQAAYGLGFLPEVVQSDDPEAVFPEPAMSRSPVSVDRSATLRWLLGGLVCWCLFCTVAHYCDCIRRALFVWGCVVGSLFLGTVCGSVQLLGGTEGYYGMLRPGGGPIWAPSLSDVADSPGVTTLRPLAEPDGSSTRWALARPDRPAIIAGWPGGPGAFLALGSLGVPLAFGLALHGLAPRGSRESFWARLQSSGQGGLPLLVLALTLLSALVFGFLGGRVLSLPIGLGLLVAGLPGSWATGLRFAGVGLTLLSLGFLGGGVVLGEQVGRPPGLSPLTASDGWETSMTEWSEAIEMARDFPLLGVGLGSFPVVHPYYKTTDTDGTLGLSTIVRWWAETGYAGLMLLGLGLLWSVVRLPWVVRKVGTADRFLAFGLIGAMVAFGLFSALHWTVDLAVVALAASAVGGTWERWLAGGTDLFAEAG